MRRAGWRGLRGCIQWSGREGEYESREGLDEGGSVGGVYPGGVETGEGGDAGGG
jgi:hypothetical protein